MEHKEEDVPSSALNNDYPVNDQRWKVVIPAPSIKQEEANTQTAKPPRQVTQHDRSQKEIKDAAASAQVSQ